MRTGTIGLKMITTKMEHRRRRKMDHDELLRQLENLNNNIQIQINFLNLTAIEMGVQIYEVKNTAGEFMLAPLLTAKANVLCAIAGLKKDDVNYLNEQRPSEHLSVCHYQDIVSAEDCVWCRNHV